MMSPDQQCHSGWYSVSDIEDQNISNNFYVKVSNVAILL